MICNVITIIYVIQLQSHNMELYIIVIFDVQLQLCIVCGYMCHDSKIWSGITIAYGVE